MATPPDWSASTPLGTFDGCPLLLLLSHAAWSPYFSQEMQFTGRKPYGMRIADKHRRDRPPPLTSFRRWTLWLQRSTRARGSEAWWIAGGELRIVPLIVATLGPWILHFTQLIWVVADNAVFDRRVGLLRLGSWPVHDSDMSLGVVPRELLSLLPLIAAPPPLPGGSLFTICSVSTFEDPFLYGLVLPVGLVAVSLWVSLTGALRIRSQRFGPIALLMFHATVLFTALAAAVWGFPL